MEIHDPRCSCVKCYDKRLAERAAAPTAPQRDMTEADRAKRNLSPHAEARAAMWIWHDKYGQSAAGSMDFYDRLTDCEKRICADCVSEIVNTPRKAAMGLFRARKGSE